MQMADQQILNLDPGIAEAVRILREHGVETCQSCEGGEEHPYPEPTVAFTSGTGMGEGMRALGIALIHGLPVSRLQCVWNVCEGIPDERVWELVFSRKLLPRSKYNPNISDEERLTPALTNKA